MSKSNIYEVKRERKKALFLREITSIIQELATQEPLVANVFVTHVDVSSNTGICYVYFSAYQDPGDEIFKQALEVLKLYKPSLRKAFAGRVQTRYAPDLIFIYDKAKEKERVINALLDKVQDDLRQSSSVDADSKE